MNEEPKPERGTSLLPELPTKLPQQAVLYKKMTPPPFLHKYECQFCLHFRKIEGKPTGLCNVVQSDIEPKAWCALWFPLPYDPPFMWVIREKQEKKG